MTDFYCDHGVYTSALGTTPTWGVPQEGDGSTKDAATASSVASIAFASVPTTGAMSVCGITIGTAGVIGAATVGAAADALAGLINAVSTTVAAGVAVGTPQLRNLVYARGPTLGAPAGTCQIMMRIGSATLNQATNASAAIASTFDGTPTLVQFAGGSGGCWGWFFNGTDIGVSSSIVKGTYGVWLFLPYVGTNQSVNDTIYIRTGGGASKSITFANASSYNNLTVTATCSSISLVFDTNTIWTGDSAVGVLQMVLSCTGYSSHIKVIPVPINGAKSVVALRRGGFELQFSGDKAVFNSAAAGIAAYFRNVLFTNNNSGETSALFLMATNYGNRTTAVYESCDLVCSLPRSSIHTLVAMFGDNGSAEHTRTFVGCNFGFNISGVSYSGQLVTLNAANHSSVTFKNCNFTGFSGKFKILPSNINAYAGGESALNITAEGCTGVELLSSYSGIQTTTVSAPVFQSKQQIVINNLNDLTNPGLRVEDSQGIAEWVPSESPTPPTLTARLVAGGAPWSVRLIWLASVPLSSGRPYRSPPVRMLHQLASGVRTLTLQLFVPTTVVKNVRATFGYVDSTGVARIETADALQTGSATWANAGAFPTHVSKILTVTTAYLVAANSEITCAVELTGVAPASVVAVYLDPEFGVA